MKSAVIVTTMLYLATYTVANPGLDICTICDCIHNPKDGLNWVVCSKNYQIREIPQLPYATKKYGVIEAITLFNTSLRAIKENTFKYATGLKKIEMDNTNISYIPENLFRNLTALENLKLYNTKVDKIPTKLFSSNVNLKSVHLHSNNIRYLPEDLFYSNPLLDKLDLSGNKISELPRKFFSKTKELTWLEISNNAISKLAVDLFSKTRQLEYLDLKKNRMTFLPETLLNCTGKLEYFNVARNQLTSVPTNFFNNTPSLRKLHIDNNKFERVHPLIFDKTRNLERLSTSYLSDCCNAERMTGRKLAKCNYRKKMVDSSALEGCGYRFGGLSPRGHFGHVQLYSYSDYKWYMLCADSEWSMKEADLLCKDLHFEKALLFYKEQVNVSEHNNIVTKHHHCKGDESYLYECGSINISHRCSTNEVVVTRCKIEGERLDKVCDVSETKIDCSNRNMAVMPWVNNSFAQQYIHITSFNISKNTIRRVYRGALSLFPNIKNIDFSFNKIKTLPSDLLFFSSKIKSLNFSHNDVQKLPTTIFKNAIHLERLDLSLNNLQEFDPEILPEKNVLGHLNVSGNQIYRLDGTQIAMYCRKMKMLDISSMPFLVVTSWTFLNDLNHLESIHASKFDQCCYVRRLTDGVVCRSPEDEISDCSGLIKNRVFRSFLWIAMIFVLSSNLLAFIPRLVIPASKNSMKIFILNLMVSDFLMGVFLAGILHEHDNRREDYYIYDRTWRTSLTCKALGIISFLSSEMSLATLTVIGYTRYNSIIHGFSRSAFSKRCHAATLVILWSITLTITLIPALADSYSSENKEDGFYSGNALCLPLYLPSGGKKGWKYSFAIFACVNLAAVLYILCTYMYIFYKVMNRCEEPVPLRTKEDRHLTIRLTLIVITDLICWIPVIILLFLSLTNYVVDKDSEIYRWFVVCVFPMNAALNPIIYTFLAPRIWERFKKEICKGNAKAQDSEDRTDMTLRSTNRIEMDIMNSNSVTSLRNISSKFESSVTNINGV